MADGSIIEFEPVVLPLAPTVQDEEARTGDAREVRDIIPSRSFDRYANEHDIQAADREIDAYVEKTRRGMHATELTTGDAGGPTKPGMPEDVPLSPDQGGPLNWQVTDLTTGLRLRSAPSISADIATTYPSGTVLDNLGCQQAEGRIWCDVQQLGGGPRGFVAADYLTPAISPNGAAIMGPDTSSLRAGQGDFDATGSISCAQRIGQPMSQCRFGVARTGGGYATVVVIKPDGVRRAIFFRMGIPVGADTSQADGYGAFRAARESDLYHISVGEERYEIQDAVTLGG